MKGYGDMVTSTRPRSNFVVIDTERCKGCHLCIAFCPKEVLRAASRINRMGYAPAEVEEKKASECTGCGICTMMCPDIAITVHRLKKG
jgi:2-oxoglutarate ferredoxin oxidoreductase subunit delta